MIYELWIKLLESGKAFTSSCYVARQFLQNSKHTWKLVSQWMHWEIHRNSYTDRRLRWVLFQLTFFQGIQGSMHWALSLCLHNSIAREVRLRGHLIHSFWEGFLHKYRSCICVNHFVFWGFIYLLASQNQTFFVAAEKGQMREEARAPPHDRQSAHLSLCKGQR